MTEKQEIYFYIFSIRSDHIMVDKFVPDTVAFVCGIFVSFNSFIIIPLPLFLSLFQTHYSTGKTDKKEIFEPKSDFFVDKIVWIMWITSFKQVFPNVYNVSGSHSYQHIPLLASVQTEIFNVFKAWEDSSVASFFL